MNNIEEIAARMKATAWFQTDGCYTLFDGQYGSTGKGLLASVIAETCGDRIDTVTTNAGPNSGHVGYYMGEKILTQQIPVASIVMDRMGIGHTCYLNGGAIIDKDILIRELNMFERMNELAGNVIIHPAAAVIKPEHRGDQLSHIASTGKGVGPAMVAKLGRTEKAVIGRLGSIYLDTVIADKMILHPNELGRCFVETAQGWSLGINSGFYPYVTSRECSVAQALADLGVSPVDHRKSIVSLRTYPIRVGNTPDGFSGPVYPDQEETTFESLGVEPELTTVTKRVRRIFTWSDQQYVEMLQANKPDAIFINFMNYLPDGDWAGFANHLNELYKTTLGRDPDFILMGFGPFNSDVQLWDGVPF